MHCMLLGYIFESRPSSLALGIGNRQFITKQMLTRLSGPAVRAVVTSKFWQNSGRSFPFPSSIKKKPKGGTVHRVQPEIPRPLTVSCDWAPHVTPCEQSLLLISWVRRSSWCSARNPNFWTSQSCFLSSNCFCFSAKQPLTDKPMITTEPTAELSTLPDNQGDSRFWTVSPDKNGVCHFFRRLDFPTIKCPLLCVVWAILLLTSNVSS